MSTAKFDTLSNVAGTQTVPVATVAQGSAKAWVNFNGTGTVAIRASFNVSSITDNGTGDYTVNFTSAMTDANYSALALSNETSSGSVNGVIARAQGTALSSAFPMEIVNLSGTRFDSATVYVAVFR